MNKTPFIQKLITCLIAGLVLTAIFLVLGRAIPPQYVVPELVFGASGLCLLTSLIYPFIWQRKEPNLLTESSSIMAFLQGIIRYGLAFDISMFGFKKIFLQQFIVPYSMYDEKLGSLSGEWLTWHYFGFSYTFGLIVASLQIGGSTLLLFRRTRLLGVFLLLPVLLNILFINIFYGLNAGATLQSIILSLGLIYLLFLDYNRLIYFLLQSKDNLKGVNLGDKLIKNIFRFLMIFIPFLLVFSPYYFEIMPDNIRGTYEVKNIDPTKEKTIQKIYFERDGSCTFSYSSNTIIKGNYQFDNNKKQFFAIFNKENQQNDTLLANITLMGNNKMKMLGTFANDKIDLELLKLR